MLDFDEALEHVLSEVEPLPAEAVPIARASGRVLSASLRAPFPLPPFDYSERDGYALNTARLGDSGPHSLAVVGVRQAGRSSEATLAAGTAMRIFTGAPLPDGADAVVMQEEAERAGDTMTIRAKPRAGAFVRHRGEDLAAEAEALVRGTRLTPGSLALAAMLGVTELPVFRRPRVLLLANGDELRAPGQSLQPGQIYESNTAALAALAAQAGATTTILPNVGDDLLAARRAIERALEESDLLATIGGVSVGEHDVIRPALEGAGVRLDFWRVAIKPGKPLAFGRRGATRVLGLPGNPASALVTFGLFGLPLLRALQADVQPRPMPLPARLAHDFPLATEREQFVRATLESRADGLWATAAPQQAAGAAISLATSDGLARLPRGEGLLPAGAPVQFLRWSDL